jgi:hypothetical protein
MLTCAAVIFNLGPFAKASNVNSLPGLVDNRSAAAAARPSHASMSLSRREADIFAATYRFPPAAELQDIFEPTRGLLRLASLSLVDEAPWGQQSGRNETVPSFPDPAASDPVMKDAVSGVWAPDAAFCTARNFREGSLPTIISADGASAGDTMCMFSDRRQTESGWRVVATCASPRERWTSHVRLTVNDNRLTWTSRRGTQVYTRCTADVLMAQAR